MKLCQPIVETYATLAAFLAANVSRTANLADVGTRIYPERAPFDVNDNLVIFRTELPFLVVSLIEGSSEYDSSQGAEIESTELLQMRITIWVESSGSPLKLYEAVDDLWAIMKAETIPNQPYTGFSVVPGYEPAFQHLIAMRRGYRFFDDITFFRFETDFDIVHMSS